MAGFKELSKAEQIAKGKADYAALQDVAYNDPKQPDAVKRVARAELNKIHNRMNNRLERNDPAAAAKKLRDRAKKLEKKAKQKND